MAIIATGIDLAKNVFAVHGVSPTGAVELRQPKVARAKLNALIASLPPGVIGMEACSGGHYWARQFQAHGHTVRLMAPKLVTHYRMSGKRGKNDAADAAAICEALQRPNMRFVPIKSEDQIAQLISPLQKLTGARHLRQTSRRRASVGDLLSVMATFELTGILWRLGFGQE